ncbi:MAG: rhodanese-like domain-containing protein [Deferrisomatales bacterium]|nr:rhodanese-like domain-containing protein [Deferrisomatales bacterium]
MKGNLERWLGLTALVWVLAVTGARASTPLPGDAEAATHGDEAASVQLVKETEQKGSDFVFRQYNLAVLSHYSYLIGSGGEALIVDPARDVSRYLKDAQELGLKITKVYLTHSHADFVAGHRELAKATGAEIVVNEATGAGYPHKPVRDGDTVVLGKARGVVVTTPGHTPDGTCLYVYGPGAGTNPTLVLTGDTLFIGSVGRPDLMGEGMSAASLAEMGFRSWTDKLSKLPDDTRFFPAHGAGSLCGAHLSDEPVSTIGEQRRDNVYLQHKDLAAYVMAVIDGLPDAPQYFKHNAKLNHDGPPLVAWDKAPTALPAADVLARGRQGAWLIDVRDAEAFAAAHPQNAINIGIRGRFETWTGIMIPWGDPFVLVGSDDEVREAAFRLKRVGYDSPAGSLQGGLDAWKQAGLPVGSLKLVAPRQLYQQMQAGTAPVIVDVRLPSEWMGLRIGNVLNIPLNRLFIDSRRLSKDMPVLAVCNSAYRSSMGASVLRKLGFKDVLNLEGGGEAWIAAGLPTLSATGAGHAAAAAPARAIRLPDRISSADLKRMLMDLPGTFEVVDVRPPAQFADFNLPGSMNADIADVIANPSYLNGAAPLVIVDRDGSLAMAVGGILAQKTPRTIKVLFGGLDAYWNESSAPMPPAGSPRAGSPPPPAPGVGPATPSPAPPATPETPKKKSAGC